MRLIENSISRNIFNSLKSKRVLKELASSDEIIKDFELFLQDNGIIEVTEQDINDYFTGMFYDVETEEDIDEMNNAEKVIRNKYNLLDSRSDDYEEYDDGDTDFAAEEEADAAERMEHRYGNIDESVIEPIESKEDYELDDYADKLQHELKSIYNNDEVNNLRFEILDLLNKKERANNRASGNGLKYNKKLLELIKKAESYLTESIKLKEEFIPNHVGEKCPKCGSNNYYEVDVEEMPCCEGMIYKLVCKDCGYESPEDEYTYEDYDSLDETVKSEGVIYYIDCPKAEINIEASVNNDNVKREIISGGYKGPGNTKVDTVRFSSNNREDLENFLKDNEFHENYINEIKTLNESIYDLIGVKCVLVYFDEDRENRAGSDWTIYSHYTPQNTRKFVLSGDMTRPAKAKYFKILSKSEYEDAYRKDNITNVDIYADSAELLESVKSAEDKKSNDKRVIMQQGNVTCFKENENTYYVFENESDNEVEYNNQEDAMKDFLERVGIDSENELKED